MLGLRNSWIPPFVLLCVPPLLGYVIIVFGGWFPIGDDARAALRIVDIFGENPPLLGMPTTADREVPEVNLFHPGNLGFALIAPMSWLGRWAPWAIGLGSLVVNLGLVFVAIRVAWTSESRVIRTAVVSAFWFVMVAVGIQLFRPWNLWTSLLGLIAFLIVAWSISCGRPRLLPVFVVVASLVAQSHVVAVIIVTVVTIAVIWQRVTQPRGSRASYLQIGVASVLAILCWAGPLTDAVTNWPGNPGQAIHYLRAAGSSTTNPRDQPVTLLWWFVTLLVFAIITWKCWRTACLINNHADNEDHRDNATLLQLVSVALSTSLLIGLLGGPLRVGYLFIFSGLLILAAFMLRRPRESPWWTSPKMLTINLATFFALASSFAQILGLSGHELRGSFAPIVMESRHWLQEEKGTPILVTHSGPEAWMAVYPATHYALATDGHTFFYDNFGDRPDYDFHRRTSNLPRSHLHLHIAQQTDAGHWPEPPTGIVTQTKDFELDGAERPFRLSLFRVN